MYDPGKDGNVSMLKQVKRPNPWMMVMMMMMMMMMMKFEKLLHLVGFVIRINCASSSFLLHRYIEIYRDARSTRHTSY